MKWKEVEVQDELKEQNNPESQQKSKSNQQKPNYGASRLSWGAPEVSLIGSPPALMSSSPQSSHRSAAFGQVFVYEAGARFASPSHIYKYLIFPPSNALQNPPLPSPCFEVFLPSIFGHFLKSNPASPACLPPLNLPTVLKLLTNSLPPPQLF